VCSLCAGTDKATRYGSPPLCVRPLEHLRLPCCHHLDARAVYIDMMNLMMVVISQMCSPILGASKADWSGPSPLRVRPLEHLRLICCDYLDARAVYIDIMRLIFSPFFGAGKATRYGPLPLRGCHTIQYIYICMYVWVGGVSII